MDLRAPAQQHARVRVRQRQLPEHHSRGDQRHEPLDPLVADGVAPGSARELHYGTATGSCTALPASPAAAWTCEA